MDRYQLKNVIILILLLVNGFLLGSMAYRGTAARAARDQSWSCPPAPFQTRSRPPDAS